MALALTCGDALFAVKLLGPDQLQVTGILLVVDAANVNGLPVQTGVLDVAVGVAGV